MCVTGKFQFGLQAHKVKAMRTNSGLKPRILILFIHERLDYVVSLFVQAMPKTAQVYVCRECGAHSRQWQGQCPGCGHWNTLGTSPAVIETAGRRLASAARAAAVQVTSLGAPPSSGRRLASGLAELDRVLGGGWVAGGVVLLGGDPGIGKSTLLLQVAAQLAATHPVVYASGEESAEQLQLRAERLGLVAASELKGLNVLASNDLEAILAQTEALKPRLLVIDSIQTVELAGGVGAAGGVAQLRECAAQVVRFAKQFGIAVVLIGHVTKDGAIAGPRLLEHLVDVVLYFESDAGSRYRLVRATKNRYGAVGELAFFAMGDAGLREVRNPSAIFLVRSAQPAPGSVVLAAHDGGRELLVELQALVDPTRFTNPKRLAEGLDSNRLSMLLAVLNRHGGQGLADYDVFVNAVGGLRIADTGADLPLLLALVSSLRGRALPADAIAFGEAGLTGELRPVSYGEERLRAAARQGFRRAWIAAANAPRAPIEGLQVVPLARVADALSAAGLA
jgi:DNA repair protein RadA/Sms